MKLKALGLLTVIFSGLQAMGSPLPPAEILKKADEVRNPADSFFMKVDVLSGKELTDLSSFDVSIQGNDKTLVKTLAPVRDRGRNLLMVGEDMWAFIPNLNRAVRVSLSQKLTGQAANGDISRMRWTGDYTAQIEAETSTEWTLFLTADKKGLTYDKIRVWIEKKTFYPKKAQFLTLAGKPLKNAFYEDFKVLAGRTRPASMRIEDAVRPDEVSKIQIQEMTVKKFQPSLFNQNAMK